MPRTLLLLVAVLVASVAATAGTIVPAQADTAKLYGTVGTATWDSRNNGGMNSLLGKGQYWIRCELAGYITSDGSAGTVHIVSTCRHGLAVDVGPFNVDLRLSVIAANEGQSGCQVLNGGGSFGDIAPVQIDDGGGSTTDADYPLACGPVTQVCILPKQWWAVTAASPYCVALAMNLPVGDAAAGAYLGSGTSGCAAYTPLMPWVSTPVAVAVSGGWAWQSSITLTESGAGFGPYQSGVPDAPQIGGQYVYPDGVVKASSPSVTFAGDALWVTTAGQGLASTLFNTGSPNYTPSPTHAITGTGPVHTGAIGSVPLDWQWVGAGYYWTRQPVLSARFAAGDTFGAGWTGSTAPSDSTLGTSSKGYAGLNWPSKCLFWWGVDNGSTLSWDVPPGTLTYQNGTTPPTSAGCLTATPATCSTGVPNIIVNNNGACAGASGSFTCVHPPGDDGSSACSNTIGCEPTTGNCIYTAGDPSTWVAGSLCELVQQGIKTHEYLNHVVDLLKKIADGIASAGSTVVVPPSDPTDPNSIDYNLRSLMSLFGASAVSEWINAATSTMDVTTTAGSCEGPAVDLSNLHVPTFTVMHPFAACTGAQQQFASKAHGLLLAGVYVAGAWASARLVLWSFGITLPGKDD